QSFCSLSILRRFKSFIQPHHIASPLFRTLTPKTHDRSKASTVPISAAVYCHGFKASFSAFSVRTAGPFVFLRTPAHTPPFDLPHRAIQFLWFVSQRVSQMPSFTGQRLFARLQWSHFDTADKRAIRQSQ